MKKENNTQSGFTLMEVMIAIVMLTVAIFALLSTIIPALYLEETSQEYEQAKLAATSKLEEIACQEFATICGTYSGTNFSVADLTLQDGDTEAGYITIDNSNAALLDVEVRIRWKSGFNPNNNLEMTMKTMVAQSSD